MRMDRIISKVRDRWILYRYSHPFVRKNQERIISPENTLCLFCQPRGGSTWLAEILLTIPKSVLIDEPLWRGKVAEPFKKPKYQHRKLSEIADLNFFFNQYIPVDANWIEAESALEKILTGRAISIGLYDEQDLSNLEKGEFYITKFNYANLLMPWLIERFNFNSILLTRHPCAVIASQLQLPSWKNINPTVSIERKEFPYSEYYYSKLNKIGKIDSKEKYLAFIWALGFRNTVMTESNNKKWLTLSYERLVKDFKSEIDRINQRFSYNISERLINDKKPSKSATKRSLSYLNTDEQLSSWKKELSNFQIKIILDVLEKFEIDIYSERLEPDYDKLY